LANSLSYRDGLIVHAAIKTENRHGMALTGSTKSRNFAAMSPTWSERITALEAAGWSITNLARHIGMSPSGLSDIKHGRSIQPCGMAAVELHRLWAELPQASADLDEQKVA